MIIDYINMYVYVCMYKNEMCAYRGMEIHVELYVYRGIYEICAYRGIHNKFGDICI